MQFGISATATLPGFELAGEVTTDTGSVMQGQPSEGGTGFEALLAALVAGNTDGQIELNIEKLKVNGVTPETQEIIDALAGMAEALVPLSNAFDKLKIPTAEQLDNARDALARLVESINAHPNRPDLAIKGPIGAFAAQLSQLHQAGIDAAKDGTSDFGKVGQLMERLDKILNEMAGAPTANGQQANGEKPALNIHQMIDRLNQLADKLPTLPAQVASQLKSQAPFGNTILEAQTSGNVRPELQKPDRGAVTTQHSTSPVAKAQTFGNAKVKEQSAAAPAPTNQGFAVSALEAQAPKGLNEQLTSTQVADGAKPQQWQIGATEARSAAHNAMANGQSVKELQSAQQRDASRAQQQNAANASASQTTAAKGAEPDILAQIANLGQQQNSEVKKAERPGAPMQTTGIDTTQNIEQPTTKITFAQVSREANLQAANAYPEMQKSGPVTTATAPLSSELDAVETGTEKLLGQQKIETFQQQTNLIDAAKSQTSGRQVNIPGVAFDIVRQFRAGMQRFEVRLDPPEMGRIDVRMEVEGNNVTARLVVERAETLDFLQRDARALERALQQAGLNADRANLQFSLKQDGQGSNPSFENQGNQQDNSRLAEADSALDDQADMSNPSVYRGTTGPGGLNLWV